MESELTENYDVEADSTPDAPQTTETEPQAVSEETPTQEAPQEEAPPQGSYSLPPEMVEILTPPPMPGPPGGMQQPGMPPQGAAYVPPGQPQGSPSPPAGQPMPQGAPAYPTQDEWDTNFHAAQMKFRDAVRTEIAGPLVQEINKLRNMHQGMQTGMQEQRQHEVYTRVSQSAANAQSSLAEIWPTIASIPSYHNNEAFRSVINGYIMSYLDDGVRSALSSGGDTRRLDRIGSDPRWAERIIAMASVDAGIPVERPRPVLVQGGQMAGQTPDERQPNLAPLPKEHQEAIKAGLYTEEEIRKAMKLQEESIL